MTHQPLIAPIRDECGHHYCKGHRVCRYVPGTLQPRTEAGEVAE